MTAKLTILQIAKWLREFTRGADISFYDIEHVLEAAQRLEGMEQVCTTAICNAPSLDENGYICTKDAAIKAVRAALEAAREA